MKRIIGESPVRIETSIAELKLLYCALWNDLKARGQLGIDEEASDLLLDLQTILQREAQEEGIDISIHSDWANWVGLDSKCSL